MGIILTEEQRFYLAGLFEGEASFTIINAKYPRIQLSMTDLDVVQKVADIFGIKVYDKKDPRPQCKPCFAIAICQKQVVCDTLTQLLPYMGERRSEKMAEQLALLKDRGVEPTKVCVR